MNAFEAILAWRARYENDVATLAWLHAELAHEVKNPTPTEEQTDAS